MDCKIIEQNELAEKYVAGGLDSSQQDEFEVHLLECSRCLDAIEMLDAVRFDLMERDAAIRTVAAGSAWLRFGLSWYPARIRKVDFSTTAKLSNLKRSYVLLATLTALFIAAIIAVSVPGRHLAPPMLGPLSLPSTRRPAVQQSDIEQLGPSNKAQPTSTALHQPQVAQRHKRPAAPSIGAAPTSGIVASEARPADAGPSSGQTTGQNAISNIPVNGRNYTDFSLQSGTSTASADQRNQSSGQANEAAAELFRLGTVEPPPYTFAGFTGAAKAPKSDGKTAATSGSSGEPNTGRALFRKGMVAYVDRRYNAAADLLENALRIEPKAADVNLYLGICRLIQGRPADAVPLLKVVSAAPDSVLTQSAHFYLGKAYVQTGNLSDAQAEWQQAAATPGRLAAEARSLLLRLRAARKPDPQNN